MIQKKILIIIDDLGRGGAETLLTGILADIKKHFSIILVTLSDKCDFYPEQIICDKKYSLGFQNKISIPSCISKLKKIIKDQQPSLIHSHLFYSSLIARISCPAHIPLIYSLHGEMSKNVFNNSRVLTFLEKNTIRKNHFAMAVSKEVLKDYNNSIGENSRSFVLKNYISNVFFEKEKIKNKFGCDKKIKLVAVGNIKKVKNYKYLLKAFGHLKKHPVSLDIYGNANPADLDILREEISKENLPVILKGPADDIHELLPAYDMYVSCSKHEGFGLAAIEAMACGLPLLLSDLPVYHEVTLNNALFFDVKHPLSFVNLINEIVEKKHDIHKLSFDGINISKKYTKELYVKKLFSIYDEVLKIADNKFYFE